MWMFVHVLEANFSSIKFIDKFLYRFSIILIIIYRFVWVRLKNIGILLVYNKNLLI